MSPKHCTIGGLPSPLPVDGDRGRSGADNKLVIMFAKQVAVGHGCAVGRVLPAASAGYYWRRNRAEGAQLGKFIIALVTFN